MFEDPKWRQKVKIREVPVIVTMLVTINSELVTLLIKAKSVSFASCADLNISHIGRIVFLRPISWKLDYTEFIPAVPTEL